MSSFKEALSKINTRPDILNRVPANRFSTLPKDPQLTIITSSMNLGRFLAETLNSVENQSYRNFEHIIIDGGSTDETLEILKDYPHLIVISEKDHGYLDALWKGLKMARGKYVLHCCVSDGYLDTDWLKRCVEHFEQHPETSLIWGLPQYLSEDSKLGKIAYEECGFLHKMPPQAAAFIQFWLDTALLIPEGNLCVRTDVFKKCFPPYIPGTDKYVGSFSFIEFNYQFNTQGYLPHYIPVVANFGRSHSDQIGHQKAEIGQRLVEHYENKVVEYRQKILEGSIKHIYRDGFHRPIETPFTYVPFTYKAIWKQQPPPIKTKASLIEKYKRSFKKRIQRLKTFFLGRIS